MEKTSRNANRWWIIGCVRARMSQTELATSPGEVAVCELQLVRGPVLNFTTTWTKPKWHTPSSPSEQGIVRHEQC